MSRKSEYKKVSVIVTLRYKHLDVTKNTLKEYIRDALVMHGGQFDPGEFDEKGLQVRESHPLFFGIKRVKVGAITDEPTSVQLLLQTDEPKKLGPRKVQGRGGRRRSI